MRIFSHRLDERATRSRAASAGEPRLPDHRPSRSEIPPSISLTCVLPPCFFPSLSLSLSLSPSLSLRLLKTRSAAVPVEGSAPRSLESGALETDQEGARGWRRRSRLPSVPLISEELGRKKRWRLPVGKLLHPTVDCAEVGSVRSLDSAEGGIISKFRSCA